MKGFVESLQGTVQPDGSFTFDRIAPGDYTAAMFVAGSEEFKVKVTVPAEERRDAEIVIPAPRQLSVRLGIEKSVPAAARPLVTLRFVEAAGAMTPLAVDGSFGESPLKFSLREGQYRVTATVREAVAGSGDNPREDTDCRYGRSTHIAPECWRGRRGDSDNHRPMIGTTTVGGGL